MLAGWQSGSCRGLQILVHRFNSGTGLQKYTVLFRLSSAVEQSAVNRLVACSNQAAGANKKPTLCGGFFIGFCSPDEQAKPVKNQLEHKNNRCSGYF